MSNTRVSRRTALLTLVGAPLASRAQPNAVPAEVNAELAGSRLHGTGRFSYFGLTIYDARLGVGERFDVLRVAQEPLALELQYARAIQGPSIAERSLVEMLRGGGVSAAQASRWLAEMTRIFPDVTRGSRLTGVQRPNESARFFFNGELRGEIRDPEFAPRFFGIWLSPQTSAPQLRQALLGNALAPA